MGRHRLLLLLLLLRIERHGFGFIGQDSLERETLRWGEREDECFSGARYHYTFKSRETSEKNHGKGSWVVEGRCEFSIFHPSPREFSRNVRFSIETFKVRERERNSLFPHLLLPPRRRQFQTSKFLKNHSRSGEVSTGFGRGPPSGRS